MDVHIITQANVYNRIRTWVYLKWTLCYLLNKKIKYNLTMKIIYIII